VRTGGTRRRSLRQIIRGGVKGRSPDPFSGSNVPTISREEREGWSGNNEEHLGESSINKSTCNPYKRANDAKKSQSARKDGIDVKAL